MPLFPTNTNYWTPLAYGSEDVYPYLVTYYYHGTTDGVSTAIVEAETYVHTLNLDFTKSQVRFNNDGHGNLVVNIGAESFEIPDFEDGRTITGFAITGSSIILDLQTEGSSSTQTFGQGSLTINANDITETNILGLPTIVGAYLLEQVAFSDGTVNMRNGVLIEGTDESEVLRGFDVNDQTGTAYNDTLLGFGGDDELYGFAGNDTLNGGAGDDYLSGGVGDDTYILGVGDGTSTGTYSYLTEEIGEGSDTIRITGMTPDELRILGTADLRFGLLDGSGGYGYQNVNTHRMASGMLDFWQRYEAIEFDDGTIWDVTTGLHMIGTEAADGTFGTEAGDTMEGRGGDDELYGFAGNDTLNGGAGDDYLSGGVGDDTYILGVGDGTSTGTYSYLTEEIGEGSDTIRITGMTPDELRIFGTAYLNFGLLDGSGGYGYQIVNTHRMASGMLDFWQRYEAVEFDDGTIWDVTTGLYMIGTEAADSAFGTEAGDTMEGRGGNDQLSGFAGNDTLNGGADDDYLSGGAGDDTIFGGGGHDNLNGDGGNDVLRGDSGDDRINGGKGTDRAVFTGTADTTVSLKTTAAQATGHGHDALIGIENLTTADGNDHLTGNGKANVLKSGAGNDTILGGGGNDILKSGGGRDVLRGDAGDDLLHGGKGKDRAEFAGTVDTTVSLSTTAAQATGHGNDRLIGIEDLTTAGGNDHLTGNGKANVLKSGAGNDTIFGGGGDDVLRGDKGNDTLDGGGGADRFVFKRGDGSDTINNFNTGQDRIQIGRGASDFSDLTITRSGSDVEVTFANVSITFDGLDVADITSDLFIF